jgi:hypothetical protein
MTVGGKTSGSDMIVSAKGFNLNFFIPINIAGGKQMIRRTIVVITESFIDTKNGRKSIFMFTL